MPERVAAAIFVLFVWWISTAVVLAMVWLRRSAFGLSVALFSLLGTLGFVGLYITTRATTVASAYAAFGCSLMVWGWHELMFLLGAITGPRKLACPPGAVSWRRFGYATLSVLHHEIALAVTLAAIVCLTWNQPNQVGSSTFLVLWVMRLSAKLNIFLGVPNVSEEFVPDHLRYLTSYFRRARMNALMPFSVVLAGGVLVLLVEGALACNAPRFEMVGRTLVASILALGLLEHLFLALPVPDAVLWRWAMPRKKSGPVDGLRSAPAETP